MDPYQILFDNHAKKIAKLRSNLTNIPDGLNDWGVQELVDKYARMSSEAANQYYAQLRLAREIQSGMQYAAFEQISMNGFDTLWDMYGGVNRKAMPGASMVERTKRNWDSEKYLQYLKDNDFITLNSSEQITSFLQEVVSHAGQKTITKNTKYDPSKPRYARIPQGVTCAFCTMLSGRGFVYWNDTTAGANGNFFHHDCDCLVAPSWGSREQLAGYHPEEYKAMYDRARKAAIMNGNLELKEVNNRTNKGVHNKIIEGGYRDILREMRWIYPDRMKDGALQKSKRGSYANPGRERIQDKEKRSVTRLVHMGNNIELIPRSTKPTNDFFMNGVEWELKQPGKARYYSASNLINEGYKKGKTRFIIDISELKGYTGKLERQIQEYPTRNPDKKINGLIIINRNKQIIVC